ncbi:unnamed protein product [Paramecium sonneborni]|uniref:Uncharacterized protein n=1 Tax=Paramecium sonneborni TaxID=65129 RepID=A0A8S1L0W1_9CILI|nr:unnamed protein product [Paramecium sonneborni]
MKKKRTGKNIDCRKIKLIEFYNQVSKQIMMRSKIMNKKFISRKERGQKYLKNV